MTTEIKQDFTPRGAYEEAVLGFREYWYPACMPGEVTDTPRSFMFLGDPVMMVRRNGEIFALKDECPHRGTALSLVNTRKNLEFPGTFTTTCAYHGWTFDVRDGKCVAVVSEGPDSPVPQANIRAKTYPVEVRRGIVWIWMGNGKPVPVEDDIPNILLDPKAVIHGIHRVKYGNWRFHVENVAAGHGQMVHKSTLQSWFGRQLGTPAVPVDGQSWPAYSQDSDAEGIDSNSPPPTPGLREYPGLGVWHNKPRWQRILFDWIPKQRRPLRGAQTINTLKLILPGITRVPNSPILGWLYYEWYVPVDELHYIYFQIMAYWPKTMLERAITELKYFFWHKATGPILFNNQDAAMVGATTKFFTRTGSMRYLTSISPNDQIDVVWRAYCDEHARGVGTAYRSASRDEEVGAAIVAEEQAIAVGGAGD